MQQRRNRTRPSLLSNFSIDLSLAKSLRDDCHHLSELLRTPSHGRPRSAAELEEEQRLRASIAERARAIGCPVGYGVDSAMNDSFGKAAGSLCTTSGSAHASHSTSETT
jgi:hypothetical protein